MANQADVGQALQGAGVKVMNLAVKDVGGFTAVYGSVASLAEKEKAEEALKAKVGKLSSHIEVAGAAPGTTAPAARTYTVKAGDTLSKIANEFYGNASDWKKIHVANADLISNPDRIQVGWTLKIP